MPSSYVSVLLLFVAVAVTTAASSATTSQSLIRLYLLSSRAHAPARNATNSGGLFHCGVVNSSALQVRTREMSQFLATITLGQPFCRSFPPPRACMDATDFENVNFCARTLPCPRRLVTYAADLQARSSIIQSQCRRGTTPQYSSSATASISHSCTQCQASGAKSICPNDPSRCTPLNQTQLATPTPPTPNPTLLCTFLVFFSTSTQILRRRESSVLARQRVLVYMLERLLPV